LINYIINQVVFLLYQIMAWYTEDITPHNRLIEFGVSIAK